MMPVSGLKQRPCWVTEEGQQVDTMNEAEVKNGWCFAGGRDTLRPVLKKKIKAFVSTCTYSKACTEARRFNKLDPREKSWAHTIGLG